MPEQPDTNTSATGGYLLPVPSGPVTGLALALVIQPWVAGLSGLDGSLVRPLWQENPPPKPDISVTWISFGIKQHRRDWSAWVRHVPATDDTTAYDLLYRNEELEVRCSCTGPCSDAAMSNLWNGCQIKQNLEYLFLNGLGWISIDDPVTIGEKVKERYVGHVDCRIRLRRAVALQYSVLDLAGAQVTINLADPPLTEVVNVSEG